MKVWERLKTSSKWQTGFIALVWVFAQPWLAKQGITEEQFTQIVLVLLGLIGAQAAVDFGKEAPPKP
jgi:hypothetical protein